MISYIARRLLLMVPTLLGILFVSFVVVQFAPGGPIERVIAQISGADTGATSRISGSSGGDLGARAQPGGGSEAGSSKYRGAQGLDPEFIKSLEKQFGFDKPPLERFFLMVWNFARFDFGKSYFRDVSVIQLVKEKLPVSMSLGIWMLLLTYLISIPLGIRKAVEDGSTFDIWTSAVVIIGFAIPGFLFAIFLIVLFAGGSFFDVFPLRGLTSDNFAQLPWYGKIIDYFWHLRAARQQDDAILPRQGSAEQRGADQFVHGVVSADVFIAREQIAFGIEQSHRVHATGFSKPRLRGAQGIRQSAQHRFAHHEVALNRAQPGDAVTASMDALPQMPQLEVV